MLKKVNALEKEIKTLKQETGEDIDALYERADQNELQSALNKIKWGAELETTVANFSGTNSGVDYTNNNVWSSMLKLKMNSKISDKLKFTGRIIMNKNWSDSTDAANIQDSNQGRTDGGSKLYVERAYIDYSPTKSFTLTVGRQPSNDGPGMNLIQDTPRKATYPSLLFNGNADGIVMTYDIGVSKMKTRFAYGKGYQWDDETYGHMTENTSDISDLNVYGFFVEGEVAPKSLGQNLWVLSVVKATDFVGNALSTTSPNDENLGDATLYGLYFENNKAFSTSLNYFVSLGFSNMESNGNMVNFGYGDMPLVDGTGHAVHVGLRYDISNKTKIGYEYNQGSKKWFSFTAGSTDLMNKLSTRGKVHDVYFIKNIDMFQLVRIGYTAISYDYTGSGWHVGDPQKTDDEAKRLYVTYNVKF